MVNAAFVEIEDWAFSEGVEFLEEEPPLNLVPLAVSHEFFLM
jgi:hypothetical protein